MKKAIIFLLCLLTAIPFAGCTDQPAPTAQPTTTQEAVATEATVPTEVVIVTIPETEEVTEPTVVNTPLDHEQIQATIESIAKEYNAVGVQVAIIENGQVVGSYAYGWATRKTVPMTTDHKIRVASISKVVLGISAMLLYEDGTIDLEGDIGDIWGVTARNPMFPDYPITIWNILSHTSSIASYEDNVAVDYRSVRNRLPYSFWSVEPGIMESRCYNNYAFRVLGMTLELAANKTMDDILDEKLFNTMQIDAAFAAGDVDDISQLATLYEGTYVRRNVAKQATYHSSDIPGGSGSYFAGGFTVSAEDLGKLAALLANDGMYNGEQLLQPESVALMEQCMDQPLQNGAYQAHPLFHVPGLYGREGVYFHTGTGCGVYTCFSYDDATGDGVVVLTTGAAGYMNDIEISLICGEINSYVYDLLK